jgi:ribose transport system permease protein
MGNASLTRAVIGVFAATAVIFLLSGRIESGLLSVPSLRTVLLLGSFVIVVAFGQGLVILLGGLDLSIGSVITLGGVLLGAWVPESNQNIAWALPTILLVGSTVGVCNGLGVAVLRIPAFIMTLATGIIVQSMVLEFTQGAPAANNAPSLITVFSNSYWFGLPILVWCLLPFIGAATLFQDMSVFGRSVHAVGSNAKAARIAGLRLNWLMIACYGLSGFCAALCGCLLLGFVGSPTLSMGDPYTIDSIAAVVVGGSSILGGLGSFLGTVGGALFLGVLSNDMTAFGMSAGWRTLIQGAIIIGALLLFGALQRGRAGIFTRSVKQVKGGSAVSRVKV